MLTDSDGLVMIGPSTVPLVVVPDPRAGLGDLAAAIYGRPAQALTMYGITGTNGKTTTAYLLDSALRELGRHTGLIGTVETRVGDERIKSTRTTPEATDLHALLAVMRERGADSCVMEVSSHALAQHRVDGVRYAEALFTNLSQDHLDFHHTMDDYFAAKSELFTPRRADQGIVCVDDRWGRALADTAPIPVTTLSSRPDVPADWVVRGEGPHFVLAGLGTHLELICHLPGTFNLVNTALAALALLVSGVAPADVERAMAREPRVPGRMEVVTMEGIDGPRCVVDYAHTPEAVAAALVALRPSTPGRLIVVLGAGGDRDRGKRELMGAAAARHADVVVVTDDNPRGEDPAAIRAAVVAGARAEAAGRSAQPPRIEAVDRRAKAIAWAIAQAAKDRGAGAEDTVVVLGKGHETGQDVAGVVHPFDDRDAVRAALSGTAYEPGRGEVAP